MFKQIRSCPEHERAQIAEESAAHTGLGQRPILAPVDGQMTGQMTPVEHQIAQRTATNIVT